MDELEVLFPLPTVSSCLLTQIAEQPIPRRQLGAFRHVDARTEQRNGEEWGIRRL